MPGREEMPDTIKRSPEKAQRTQLLERARSLGADVRSDMTKEELAEAIAKKQR